MAVFDPMEWDESWGTKCIAHFDWFGNIKTLCGRDIEGSQEFKTYRGVSGLCRAVAKEEWGNSPEERRANTCPACCVKLRRLADDEMRRTLND